MGEILESDWTLGAIKRREDGRLKNERASATSDIEGIRTHPGNETSINNWLAEAFRRRQEEQRSKEFIDKLPSGDRAQAAKGKEIPVDHWLIEGFKRHEEERRQKEQAARSLDVAPNPVVKSDFLISGLESSAVQGQVALEQLRPREDGAACSPVIAEDRGIVLKTGKSRRAGRQIMILGLIALGGLFLVVGLQTAFLSPPKFPKQVGGSEAPNVSLTSKKEETNPGEGASRPATEKSPATKLMDNESGSRNSKMQSPAPPEGQGEHKIGAPTVREENKRLPGDRISPTAPTELMPRAATEAASPVETGGKLNAEPTAVGPEQLREPKGPEQDPNSSETKQPTVSKKTEVNPQQPSKAKSAITRHSSPRTDGFSAFLRRTTNSVRKFFGSLRQNSNSSRR